MAKQKFHLLFFFFLKCMDGEREPSFTIVELLFIFCFFLFFFFFSCLPDNFLFLFFKNLFNLGYSVKNSSGIDLKCLSDIVLARMEPSGQK